jgi:hypothetical protein
MHSLLSLLTPPPDLLRRFVETPLHSRMYLNGVCVQLMTNEFQFLQALSGWADSREESAQESVLWKLIADPDAGVPVMQPVVTDSGAVLTAWFGRGNLLSLDWECRMAYAFLSPQSAQLCAQFMAPMLSSWIANHLQLSATGEGYPCS